VRKMFRFLGSLFPIALAVMALAGPATAQAPVEINATVVDANGGALETARTPGAPEFGFDVSAQKARSAAGPSLPGSHASAQTGVRFPYLRYPPFPFL
jgi:uncharacterized protein GlcG (DUF336 family)